VCFGAHSAGSDTAISSRRIVAGSAIRIGMRPPLARQARAGDVLLKLFRRVSNSDHYYRAGKSMLVSSPPLIGSYR
jgi:hypothetical protein